jgi:hypothetical protein
MRILLVCLIFIFGLSVGAQTTTKAKTKPKKAAVKVTAPKKTVAPKPVTKKTVVKKPVEKKSVEKKPTKEVVEKPAPAPVVQEKAKVEHVSTMASRTEARLGVMLFQEDIEATRAGTTGLMQMQSEGFSVGSTWTKPYEHSRWAYTYGVDISFGFIKGSSLNGTFNDILKNQRWVNFGGRVGMIKRTSPHTSVGFEVPAYFRMIGWDLNDDTFKLDKESSFSVGAELIYEIHFSSQSTLHMAMGNQYLWKSTMWFVGYEGKIW